MRTPTRFTTTILALTLAATFAAATIAVAADLVPIQLPAPKTEGGMPLMQALKLRSTSRTFAPDALPNQTLANLLWAAWGINRPDGKRTAPSARNMQEIDVLVILPAGTYVYDAAANTLKPLAAGDQRALAGSQDFVKDAPLTLLYVADTSKVKSDAAEKDLSWVWADAGFIGQNVYLFCASEGLVTGVRAMMDRPALSKALKLAPTQVILLAQSVGFPKK